MRHGAMWVAALAAWLAGCAATKEQPLVAPQVTVAPYETARGQVLWAVAPLRNESGATLDAIAISDQVVAAAEQVQGVRCLPMNRTLETMRGLGLEFLASPGDAKALAAAMGADGIIVGSITAYDPYTPTVGLSLALLSRTAAMDNRSSEAGLDVRRLASAPTDYEPFPRSNQRGAPVSVVSEYLDAKNHAVLASVRGYADGRLRESNAVGWRSYTKSAPMFTEFAAWYAVDRLVQQEWIRLARQRATAGVSAQ
jgi:hypothetical protein